MDIQERYSPEVIPVNGTYQAPSGVQNTGCFLASTAGILTVSTTTGVVLVTIPVVAAGFYKLPFKWGGNSWIVTLSMGASGVLGVAS